MAAAGSTVGSRSLSARQGKHRILPRLHERNKLIVQRDDCRRGHAAVCLASSNANKMFKALSQSSEMQRRQMPAGYAYNSSVKPIRASTDQTGSRARLEPMDPPPAVVP